MRQQGCHRQIRVAFVDRRNRVFNTHLIGFLLCGTMKEKILQSQHKTVRRAFTTNVCGWKSFCELFPLATTQAKVVNSGNSEVRELATACVIFFKK